MAKDVYYIVGDRCMKYVDEVVSVIYWLELVKKLY